MCDKLITDFPMKDPMPCPHCGKNNAENCGHSVTSFDGEITEYDCDFNVTEISQSLIHDCSYCPLLWCKACKEDAVMSTFITLEIMKQEK